MLSIVIPVLNENASLGELYTEIVRTAELARLDVEVVFVDDGSRDGSWETVRDLARKDKRVRGIRFRRNFGKAAALSAGFRSAGGDVIMTLDADLQDDPNEIPRFLEQINGGLDVVSGWKKVRLDPWHKVWPSRVFNALVGWLTGVRLHDHNCGMKCYRAEVFREVKLYGEMHRFIPVMASARGFRVGELVINHRPRKHGHSKYGARRFIKGLLDLLTIKFLTDFSHRPQHFLGSLGLFFFILGGAGLLYLSITWIIRLWAPDAFPPLHERAMPTYALASLLLGCQLLSIGFLAELFTAFRGREEDNYSISDRTDRPTD